MKTYKIIADNGNVYTYTNRVDFYNDRVGQARLGMHNLRGAIDKIYSCAHQDTTSAHRPKALEQIITYQRCHQLR